MTKLGTGLSVTGYPVEIFTRHGIRAILEQDNVCRIGTGLTRNRLSGGNVYPSYSGIRAILE